MNIYWSPTWGEFEERHRDYLERAKRVEKCRLAAMEDARIRNLQRLRASRRPAIPTPLSARLRAFKKQKRLKENRERRALTKWPDHKLRRSRVDWYAIMPSHLAARQVAWERAETAHHMRTCGFQLSQIADAFGVSTTRARAVVARADRWRVTKRRSPAETWFQQSSEPPMDARISVIASSFLKPRRDWMIV